MTFSYNKVWDKTVSITRALLPLLLAIAGVFIFLPGLVLNHFAPAPAMTGADPQAVLTVLTDYWRANWHWNVIVMLLGMTGTLAMSILIFDERHPTVRTAIGQGLILLPSYLVCAILTAIVLSILLLLIVTVLGLLLGAANPLVVLLAAIPCLYLYGRVAIIGQVIAAEDRRGPFNALGRTLELTQGRAWAISGLVLGAFLLTGVVGLAVRSAVGVIARLLLDAQLATFIELVVISGVGAAMAALVVVLYAAIYRTLAPSRSATALVD